jgi:hypothetical protein
MPPPKKGEKEKRKRITHTQQASKQASTPHHTIPPAVVRRCTAPGTAAEESGPSNAVPVGATVSEESWISRDDVTAGFVACGRSASKLDSSASRFAFAWSIGAD